VATRPLRSGGSRRARGSPWSLGPSANDVQRVVVPDELRGHAVLVDFWTPTCIDWLRQEPYVRA
jgi:hypothetical protein